MPEHALLVLCHQAVCHAAGGPVLQRQNDRMCHILCSWLLQRPPCKLCTRTASVTAFIPICLGIFLFWANTVLVLSPYIAKFISWDWNRIFAQCALDVTELPGDREVHQRGPISQGKTCRYRAFLLRQHCTEVICSLTRFKAALVELVLNWLFKCQNMHVYDFPTVLAVLVGPSRDLTWKDLSDLLLARDL